MDCIFCRIAAGEISATVIATNEHAIAFHDLAPQAPVHVLVIPRVHVRSAADIATGRASAVFGPVMQLAVDVARDLGLSESGYRLVVNSGAEGGQSVDHLHVHLLGGRQMHWPPG